MSERKCRCGREGLDSMFHSEQCPVFEGSRPAIYDGWGQGAQRNNTGICPDCGKVWDHSEYTIGQCSGCGRQVP